MASFDQICSEIKKTFDSAECMKTSPSSLCEKMGNIYSNCSKSGPFLPVWAGGLLISLLIVLSGIFSGLTLGLLSLSLGELKVLSKAQNDKFGRYAKRVIKVRRHGNWLLCSLLLGNVAVNSAMTILLDELFAGNPIGSVAISTTLITFFGEILPQAVFSRQALLVGYYSVPLVFVIMAILAPVAWPIGKLLDLILGKEIGFIYSNEALKELVEMHVKEEQSGIGETEGRIIRGAFDMSKLTIGEIMTKWDKVYSVNASTKLSFDVLLDIFRMGFSRIPVVTDASPPVKALFVKDLILLDPEDESTVGAVADLYGRKLSTTRKEESVREAMKRFAAGHNHMAVVTEGNVPVGIVTLEDVVERILNFEIVDETDINKDSTPFDLSKLSVFDYRRIMPEEKLVPQEITAIARIIKKRFPTLVKVKSKPDIESEMNEKGLHISSLKLLLKLGEIKTMLPEQVQNTNEPQGKLGETKTKQGAPSEQLNNTNEFLLSKSGEPSKVCYFLLEGKLEVEDAVSGKTRLARKWDPVGIDALVREVNGVERVAEETVRIKSPVKLLAISEQELKEILDLQKDEASEVKD